MNSLSNEMSPLLQTYNYKENFSLVSDQGIIAFTGTETFAKEPKFAKLMTELKFGSLFSSIKKFSGFSLMF